MSSTPTMDYLPTNDPLPLNVTNVEQDTATKPEDITDRSMTAFKGYYQTFVTL